MKLSDRKCELCDMLATKSAIVGDVYYRDICLADYDRLMSGQEVSSGQADYNRSRDLENHEADIRQPYTDGKPDASFIRLYPDTAKKIFSAEDIRQAFRS